MRNVADTEGGESGCRAGRVRVVHVLGGNEVGGIASSLSSLVAPCRQAGVETAVAILARTELAATAQRWECDTYVAGGPRAKGILPLWRAARYCRETGADIVHIHSVKGSLFGILVKRLRPRTPVVMTVHSDPEMTISSRVSSPMKRKLLLRLYAEALRRADRVIASSNAVKTFILAAGVAPERVEVIFNGIDVQATARQCLAALPLDGPDPSGSRLVGSVGRLTPVKNHRYLIEAMRIVVGRVKGARCLIVGDGPERPALENLARTAGLEGVVRFAGWQSDVVRYVAGLDIYVVPSVTESFSMSILTAMACSKSVIATRVGGNPELVEDGKTGMLIPLEQPDALAGTIASLLENDALRARMGEEGRRKAEREFSLDRMVRGYVNVYRWAAKSA